ncbi:MAG: hypothetical protein OXE50_06655 [Chloroflexi bacterium]|nr:hypothetical protein [Chloroflexota bacterium]
MAPLVDIDSAALWSAIEAAGPRLWAHRGSESADSDEALREEHARRRTFIAWYGYAAPTREAVRAVADFLEGRTVLEVCAGLGLWARLLRDEGVSVLATDAGEQQGPSYICVEQCDALSAVDAHGSCDALLLCWPPEGQPVAAEALRRFGGERLVYVGDGRFTGDAAFHDMLGSDWRLERRLPLPSWPGLEDCLRLYARNPRG